MSAMNNSKNRGFTLVELLAIIIIIGVVAAISITSINGVNKKIKEKMLQNKLELIESAAELYVNKNTDGVTKASIKNSEKKYHPGNHNIYSCTAIKVKDLVKIELIESDTGSVCNSDIEGDGCVINPADNSKYLDDVEVILYYKNNRVYAKADIDNVCVGNNNDCGGEYSNCYLYGDVNGDNSVTITDSSALGACQQSVENPFCKLSRYDVNLDNQTDCYDVCLIMKYLMNSPYVPTLPITSNVPDCSPQLIGKLKCNEGES